MRREACVEEDMKIITSGGRALGLFDLAHDPGEKHDLIDDIAKARPIFNRAKAFLKTVSQVVERPK
jgi:hypothetical protein